MPHIWLISDARNDAGLERAIARLPWGSGMVFRHYHLDAGERRERFDRLARLVRRRGGKIVLAGDIETARRWRADGVYGPPGSGAASGLIRLLTVHDMRELRMANAISQLTDFVLISPIFPTRTHPGGKTLGVAGFAALARLSRHPVIALGGMTFKRARQIAATTEAWAAIDGLSA